METMQGAIERLRARGYGASFRATAEGLLDPERDVVYPPEQLLVDETVRFEGASDPDDEAILLALRSRDGDVRGTFLSVFGPGADPDAAEAMRRLAPAPEEG